MFPANLSAAYNRDRQHAGPAGRTETSQHPHAATASTKSLSSSGVHGVNLGGVMIGRREEGGDEEEIGRRGGGKSMVAQASFKGPGTGHPLTSKTLIQKRYLLPWFFVFPNWEAETGPRKVTRRKKYPLENSFQIPISRGSNRVFRGERVRHLWCARSRYSRVFCFSQL